MANTTGKKFGGREKGTPNRLTKELRPVLKDLVSQELEKIFGVGKPKLKKFGKQFITAINTD